MTTRVLLVDDDDMVRRSTARLLAALGVEIALLAASGEEAIAHIEREGPPDLVLLDLTMPGLGGLETARRLLAMHPALAIVVVSGHLDSALASELGALGVRESLAKPFGRVDLARVINEHGS